MKQFLYILIALCFSFGSCEKIETSDCNDIKYNTAFTVGLDQMYCLPDGNYIYIEEFQTSYCPCSGDCIWEGELLTKISFNFDGEIEKYDIHERILQLNTNPTDNYSISYANIKHEGKECAFELDKSTIELIITRI